jgi:mono/diheme cytochrome c family protein
MRVILTTVLSVAVLFLVGATIFVLCGTFNVAANEPHWPTMHWVMEMVRVRSIKVRAGDLMPPVNLADEARIIGGTAHFAEHCASCHTAPGVPADDMADGMYPKPPVLTEAAHQWTPGELFWIVKNGIKMSGMPSWAEHGDDQLWNIVAFLEKLPAMTEQDYAGLIMATMHAGGHHMHGASH